MTTAQTTPRFISLRWRFMLPIFMVVLIAAMGAAYFLGDRVSSGMEIPQVNFLLQNSRAVSEGAAVAYEHDRSEAERIAFTRGVPEMIVNGQEEQLQPILESLARLAELDSAIITDANGVEVVGLLRGQGESEQYTVSTGSDLTQEAVIEGVVNQGYIGATELARTPNGLMLYTGVPVKDTEQNIVGVALVGRRLETFLTDLGVVTDLAVYGQNGDLLQTTFETQRETVQSLTLDNNLFREALASAGQRVTTQNVSIGGQPYQAAYVPFVYGPNTLGVFGVLSPDNIPFVTEIGRQLTSLAFAAVAGVVVIAAFWGINVMVTGRVDRVTQTAQGLAQGHSFMRTGMQATDEIGAVGQALDQYADAVQTRQDALRVTLRRQRRESEIEVG